MTVAARFSDVLFVALWTIALVGIFWPHPVLASASAFGAAGYAILAFLSARRQIQMLSAAMMAVAVALAGWTDRWAALPRAGESVAVFAAFFGTLALMRAAADARPEVGTARAMVARLKPAERAGGLAVGAHLLGAVLSVSVMAVFAPIVGREAPAETRRAAAEACQRGMCLSCLWSPFWLAMAFCYEHLPEVKLWQIMALGMALAALGLLVAQAMYARGTGLGGLWRALKGFAPAVPPLAVAAAVILALTALTPLSTLQSLVLGIPALCLGALLAQGAERLRSALAQTRRGVRAVAAEMVLLCAALALGRVLESLLAAGPVHAALAAWSPPPALVIVFIAGGIALLALAGIHQIVGATIMLAMFSTLPLGVADVALMEAVLLGWAFASMCGISAVSVAAAGTMFGVPFERIAYGPNLRFLLVFGPLAAALLAALNPLF